MQGVPDAASLQMGLETGETKRTAFLAALEGRRNYFLTFKSSLSIRYLTLVPGKQRLAKLTKQ